MGMVTPLTSSGILVLRRIMVRSSGNQTFTGSPLSTQPTRRLPTGPEDLVVPRSNLTLPLSFVVGLQLVNLWLLVSKVEVCMITMKTVVEARGISGKTISDFMLNCTNEDYRNWWAGTHLAFHTTKRFPSDHGNLVYFEEYVGRRRLKFAGVVVKSIPGKEIVWQMKKLIKLPVWLFLQFEDNDEGVAITHMIKAGFAGIGRLFDPFLRLYCTRRFEKDLEEHAHIEFNKLARILS